MKAYRRNRGLAPLILNLGTNGKLRAPDALRPETPHALNGRSGGQQNWTGRFGEQKILLPPAEFESRTVQPVAQSPLQRTRVRAGIAGYHFVF